jgi:hypothetical protein
MLRNVEPSAVGLTICLLPCPQKILKTWDCILINPRDYELYVKEELNAKIFSRVNIETHNEATECHINQIMANIQQQKVNAITLTQGEAF